MSSVAPPDNEDDGDEASVKHLDWRLEPAAKSFSLSLALSLALAPCSLTLQVTAHWGGGKGKVGCGDGCAVFAI